MNDVRLKKLTIDLADVNHCGRLLTMLDLAEPDLDLILKFVFLDLNHAHKTLLVKGMGASLSLGLPIVVCF